MQPEQVAAAAEILPDNLYLSAQQGALRGCDDQHATVCRNGKSTAQIERGELKPFLGELFRPAGEIMIGQAIKTLFSMTDKKSYFALPATNQPL